MLRMPWRCLLGMEEVAMFRTLTAYGIEVVIVLATQRHRVARKSTVAAQLERVLRRIRPGHVRDVHCGLPIRISPGHLTVCDA